VKRNGLTADSASFVLLDCLLSGLSIVSLVSPRVVNMNTLFVTVECFIGSDRVTISFQEGREANEKRLDRIDPVLFEQEMERVRKIRAPCNYPGVDEIREWRQRISEAKARKQPVPKGPLRRTSQEADSGLSSNMFRSASNEDLDKITANDFVRTDHSSDSGILMTPEGQFAATHDREDPAGSLPRLHGPVVGDSHQDDSDSEDQPSAFRLGISCPECENSPPYARLVARKIFPKFIMDFFN